MEGKPRDKKESKSKPTGEGTKQADSGSIHAPQKVAYPSEHDPKEGKWLRIARERSRGKG